MEKLTHNQYVELRHDVTVLSQDTHGEKVLLRTDGRIIKLFRRKRLLSSALYSPYAVRFERASIELALRGIRSVNVERVLRIPSIRRDAVVYTMLPGLSLRQAILAYPQQRDLLLRQWLAMFARMHAAGVYFRAAHFGNVIVQQGEASAIIDVSDTRFSYGPVCPTKRARNFKAMLRSPEDLRAIHGFGADRFLNDYLTFANLGDGPERFIRVKLAQMDPAFVTLATSDRPSARPTASIA